MLKFLLMPNHHAVRRTICLLVRQLFFISLRSPISTRLIYWLDLHDETDSLWLPDLLRAHVDFVVIISALSARFEIQNWNGWCVSCTRSDIYETNTRQANRSSPSICSMNLNNNRYFWGRFYFLSLRRIERLCSWCCYKWRCGPSLLSLPLFTLFLYMRERTSRLQPFNTQRTKKK